MTSQLKILVPGDTHLVDLVGQRDEHLKLIEGEFGSDILVRGNEITISGPSDEAQKVAFVFEELIALLRTGAPLTPDSVGRAVRMVKNGNGGVKPSRVLGEALLNTRGRSIRAKTAGQKRYVDAIARNSLVFSIGPAGTGKCVAADSLVLTDRGIIEIGDLVDQERPGAYTPVRLGVHGPGGPVDATHVYDGGTAETRRITTSFGFEIEATCEHPLLTIDRAGELCWTRADDLAPGSVVVLQRGQRMFGSEVAVDYRYIARDVSKPVQLEQLDTDFAYVMGLLTGDGCLTAKNRIVLSSADDECQAAFAAIAARFDLNVFANRQHDRVIASAQLYRLFEALGMSLGNAATKRVPKSIRRAPEPVVRAYLQGLFDADGSAERGGSIITFSTVSDHLVHDVQMLLLNFGVLSRRRRKLGTYLGERHVSWLITMTGAEAERFQDVVGFRLARKQLRHVRPRNTNVDVIPHLGPHIRAAMKSTKIPHAEHKLFGDYRIERRRPSREKLSVLVDVLDRRCAQGRSLEHLRSLVVCDDLVYQPVVSVERSTARVLDLTVPDGHAFVANGFVNHNTYLAVAMAVAALKNKEIERIVLTRPAVEAGEKLGFLPGDLTQKVDPYLRPLYDALFEMLEPDHYSRLMERGTIEVAPLAFMRGRSLNDSFIIMDEAQNTTPEQMKMFLTRLGLRSKAVVTGDVTQVDLPEGTESGLRVVQQILKNIDGLEFVHLDAFDVVRHPIVQHIVEAYRIYDDAKRESR